MNCGTVEDCGVLTLQTGLASPVTQNQRDLYVHTEPVVHGLWPETGKYGTSDCTRPSKSSEQPSKVYPCYAHAAGPEHFEDHEWEKHGKCAGVSDADDYFQQVCSLSRKPLQIMRSVRQVGSTNLTDYASALRQKGFSVFGMDDQHMQIELSACRDPNQQWHLAAPEHFEDVCGQTR